MITKHKPATPLPWESGMVESEPHCVSYFSIGQAYNLGGFEVAMTLNGKPRCQQDAAYIAHTANAYPRLVEALKAAADALWNYAANQRAREADSVLRELGEENA